MHGVASGDPLPDGVVLWTRVTPTVDAGPGSGAGPDIDVSWQVATDAGMQQVVRSGAVRTGATRDHTVKVDVAGLAPATTYFYTFTYDGERSPVGRTRTAPATGSDPADLRFALCSCSNFEGGFFAAYRGVAERDDLDLVLHVGDYIYEYGVGQYGAGPEIGRRHVPETDIVTLADYRARYGNYREDPDLRAAHQAHAFVVIWDDHEVANDNWQDGAENHDPDTQGSWRDRFDAASQAYREWMPVREDPVDPQRLYRRLEFGSLATLHVIDSRQYRSEQVGGPGAAPVPDLGGGSLDGNPLDPAFDDPSRTMLGAQQKAWFKDGLSSSAATWQLVGNPQMITPVLFPPLPQDLTQAIADVTGLLPTGPLGLPVEGVRDNKDQWDGYAAARREILTHLSDQGIDNTVFLTGDIHSSWACDVPLDPGAYPLISPSVATELVGTSVTSDNLDEIVGSPPRTTSIPVEQAFVGLNRHIKMLEFDSHGFSIVDVTAERTQMDWFYLRSAAISDRPQHDPRADIVHDRSWRVPVGTNTVEPADGPVGARLTAAPPTDAPTDGGADGGDTDGATGDEGSPAVTDPDVAADAAPQPQPTGTSRPLPVTGGAPLLGLGAAAVAAADEDAVRVYVVVVDGLRPDQVDRMPFLSSLRDEGTSFPESRAQMLAETTPNHVAMLTGVRSDRHGMPGNAVPGLDGRVSDDRRYLKADTLFTLAARQAPELVTAAATSKDYVVETSKADRTGDRREDATATNDPVLSIPLSDAAPDVEVGADALRLSRDLDPDFLFVNLGDVDRVGHLDLSGGLSSALPTGAEPLVQQVALQTADLQLRLLVEELRRSSRWERTVLMVTADHSMDWSRPDRAVDLAAAFDDDPLLADEVIVAVNGGACLYALRAPDEPDADERLRRMRAIALATDGVERALYLRANPADGGDAHTVRRRHPDWGLGGDHTAS